MVNEQSFKIAEKIKAQERKERKERNERITFTILVLLFISIIFWGIISQLPSRDKKLAPSDNEKIIIVENLINN